MNKNRKILLDFVLMITAAAALYLLYSGFKPVTYQGEKNFTVKVVYQDASEKTFEYTSDNEYLGEVLLNEGLIKGKDGAYGIYITEVDGEQAIYEKDKAYWALFVNGEYATSGIDTTPIKDGDKFSLVYTIG